MNNTELRAHSAQVIADRLSRPNDGRIILHDASAGLGKTRAAMSAIGDVVRLHKPDAVVACWHSTDQLLDALKSCEGALYGIEVRDAKVDVPEGWDRDMGIAPWQQIPALIYRGKEQLCQLVGAAREQECHGCHLKDTCPYTWQGEVMNSRELRLVLGSHALLKGAAAVNLAEQLQRISHVVVDEDDGAGVLEVAITLGQVRDIMRMCAWELGATGYPELVKCISSLTSDTTHVSHTANGQAQIIMDALNQVRTRGVFGGDWTGLRILLTNVVDNPQVFDTQAEHVKHVTELNQVRQRYGDTSPYLMPRSRLWSTAKRPARDLLKIIELLINPYERRKVVSVDMGRTPSSTPILTAAWTDSINRFTGSNGQPADFHYLNATPTTLLLKMRHGLFQSDKYERHVFRVANDNLCVRLYNQNAVFNGKVFKLSKFIDHLVDKALAEQGGSTLLILPKAALAAFYSKRYASRPEVHVTYIQILAGVNKYEHCNSCVVAGNFIPGAFGMTDLATLVAGLPMLHTWQTDPSVADPPFRPFDELAPGKAAAGEGKLMRFNMFHGFDLTDIADAMIGDLIWQGIQRTRPINKVNPVHAYLLTNFDFAGYVQRKGYVVELQRGDLTSEMRIIKPHAADSTFGKVHTMVTAAGGFLLDVPYLRARRDAKGKLLFKDYNTAYNFMRDVDPATTQRYSMATYLNQTQLFLDERTYGMFRNKVARGLFINQASADTIMNAFIDSENALEQQLVEARALDVDLLENEILRQLRAYYKPISTLARDIGIKLEFRNFDKVALRDAIVARMAVLEHSGRVYREGKRYRLFT